MAKKFEDEAPETYQRRWDAAIDMDREPVMVVSADFARGLEKARNKSRLNAIKECANFCDLRAFGAQPDRTESAAWKRCAKALRKLGR